MKITRRLVQRTSRRLVQWGAIAVLLALPMLSRGSALYESFGPGASHVRQLASPWEAFLYETYSRLFGGFDDPAAVADLFQGGFWSITLFGFTISDPLALLGHLVATGAPHWPLVVGIAMPIVLAAVAGRLFCGWVCPVNTLLELNEGLRSLITRWIGMLGLPRYTVSPSVRYWVLAITLAISGLAGINLFVFVLPYAGLARDWHLGVYGQAIGFGLAFMVILAVVELLFAPRLWCRSLCPTGLVLELIGRRRILGIRREADSTCLEGCRSCISVCPVAVNPRDEVATERCLLCTSCVERCPEQILTIDFHKPRPGKHKSVTKAAALGAALALAILAPSGAEAHHAKGLPHYGYLENYPQTPTHELRFSVPPYGVTVVAYVVEGGDRSKTDKPADVMIYISVTDTRTGKAYTGPLWVSFLSTGGGKPISQTFQTPLEETVYQMRAALPMPAYNITVRIGDGAAASARLTLEPGANPWLIGVAVFVAASLVVVGVSIARQRRRRPGAGRTKNADT